VSPWPMLEDLQGDRFVAYPGLKPLEAPSRLDRVSYIPDIRETQTGHDKMGAGRIDWASTIVGEKAQPTGSAQRSYSSALVTRAVTMLPTLIFRGPLPAGR